MSLFLLRERFSRRVNPNEHLNDLSELAVDLNYREFVARDGMLQSLALQKRPI